ncbi:hypothetical protein LEP1GSC137_1026 [Leptospira borgpetersenii str. Noumea 25]|uniref:Uncharacterized protein n=1 Tax=Leptospira borgpetersenii serovar Ballum TaxID=280505 RepID=A0A0S2IWN7_LEPBO|nr:hypothetical protein LBBP_03878 [Leptospira borgpetersenii serovar Ballum]EKR00874.1 hypothetical protein LEP1GSC121_0131 [Leptospira borgpetersenii serovar Castellonis str. 200801910]EMK10675.1 hypothetical protein LEP1GSC066_2391 [Leptospira sp. serovar Kenya str. Sh9]EMO07712.1 hypothetical protein LEP1GSC137_1026 [Leptospira borgpetersenii str. Noumea 25]
MFKDESRFIEGSAILFYFGNLGCVRYRMQIVIFYYSDV